MGNGKVSSSKSTETTKKKVSVEAPASKAATKMQLSENAITVLKRRYLKKDDNGNAVEAPEDLFRRVAHHVALADRAFEPMKDITYEA